MNLIKTSFLLCIAFLCSNLNAQNDFTITYSGTENNISTFTVSRPVTTAQSSVTYRTQNGSALAGKHYTAVEGTLSFAIGEGSKTFTVNETAASNVSGIEKYQNESRSYRTEIFNIFMSHPASVTRTIDNTNYEISATYYNTDYTVPGVNSTPSSNPSDSGWDYKGQSFNMNLTLQNAFGSNAIGYFDILSSQTTLGFKATLDIKEIDNGYQVIQFYTGATTDFENISCPDNTLTAPTSAMYAAKVSHVPDNTSGTFATYSFPAPCTSGCGYTNTPWSGNTLGNLVQHYVRTANGVSHSSDLNYLNISSSTLISNNDYNINAAFVGTGSGNDDWTFQDFKFKVKVNDNINPTFVEIPALTGTFKRNHTLCLAIRFSEIVTYTTTPTITVSAINTNPVTCSGGNGTNVLYFDIPVSTTQYTDILTIDDFTGVVMDLAGNTLNNSEVIGKTASSNIQPDVIKYCGTTPYKYLKEELVDGLLADAENIVFTDNLWTSSEMESFKRALKTTPYGATVTNNILKTVDMAQIGLSGDFSQNTGFYQMFDWCTSLETFTFPETESTQSVSFNQMFYCCLKLNSVYNLDKFSNITNLESMFYSDSEIKNITFSSVENSNEISLKGTFSQCDKLETINNLDKFTNCNNLENTFHSCYLFQEIRLGMNPNAIVNANLYGTFLRVNPDCLKYLPAGVNYIPQRWKDADFTNFVLPLHINNISTPPDLCNGETLQLSMPEGIEPIFAARTDTVWQLSATEDFSVIHDEWSCRDAACHVSTDENGYYLRAVVKSPNPECNAVTNAVQITVIDGYKFLINNEILIVPSDFIDGEAFNPITLNTEYETTISYVPDNNAEISRISVMNHGDIYENGQAHEISFQLESISESQKIYVSVTNTSNESRTFIINTLSTELPPLTTSGASQTDGDFYLSFINSRSIVKMDNNGNVKYYRAEKNNSPAEGLWDFKAHAFFDKVYYSYHSTDVNPTMGFTGHNPGCRVLMDSHYNVIEKIRAVPNAKNNFASSLDGHDFLMLGENHYVTLQYIQTVANNIPAEVPHADNAVVVAAYLQEVNNGVVVWDWLSTESPDLYAYTVTDADAGANNFNNISSETYVDYVHLNSMKLDETGKLIASCRHLNAILAFDMTKTLSANKLAWILADSNGSNFSSQHYAEPLGNNYFTIFNNNNKNPWRTSLIRFHRNTATGVYEAETEWVIPYPDHYSVACGSFQIIGDYGVASWGWNIASGSLVTEFPLANYGEETFSISTDYNETLAQNGTYATYRVQKINTHVETPSTVVNTTADISDPSDDFISLREAISYAGLNGLSNDITFNFPENEGLTILLNYPLTISKNVNIDGTNLNAAGGTVILDGGDKYNGTSITQHSGVQLVIFDKGTYNLLSNIVFQKGYGDSGGAVNVCHTSTVVTISNCVFRSNSCSSNGGAIQNNGKSKVINCTFQKNTNRYNGGAIYNYNDLTISNCTFSQNIAYNGSAIYCSSRSKSVIINSTFNGNTSDSGIGAAIFNYDATVHLVNNIIVGNKMKNNTNGDVYITGGILTNASYSLIGKVEDNNYATGLDALDSHVGTLIDVPFYDVFPDVNTNEIAALNADGTLHIKTDGLAATNGTKLQNNYTKLQFWNRSLSTPAWENVGENITTTLTTNQLQVDYLRHNRLFDESRGYSIGAYSSILETPSMLVNTIDDVVDACDNLTSLREAIIFAGTGELGNEITFDNTVFTSENHTITLDENEISVDKDIIVTGLTGIGTNLTANISANINVVAGKKLTINNISTDNKVNVNLKSDATGDAILIHNSQIYGTMERYMSCASSGSKEETWSGFWHFLSSPVVNQDISNDFTPNTSDYDFYCYDEKDVYWRNIKSSNFNIINVFPSAEAATQQFKPGRGYLTAYEAASGETSVTKTFSGKFNQGIISIPLTYSSSNNDLKGFNLIGNPYPSVIDWNSTSWTKTNIDDLVYIWDNAAQNYAIYQNGGTFTLTGSQFIAPNQGFFVKANNSNASLSMNNDVRTTESAIFRDTSSDGSKTLKLNVSNKFGKDEVAVTFGANSVIQSDATKLFTSNENAPSLYLPYNQKYYSILYLGENPSIHSIPMSFEVGADGFYTISRNSDVSRFDFLELKDLQKDVKINLLIESSYTFAGKLGDDPNRFRINFILSDENSESSGDEPIIFVSNGDLVVNNINGDAIIEVIDIQGRVVKKYNASCDFRKNINVVEGIYLVRVIDGNGLNVKKVIMNSE